MAILAVEERRSLDRFVWLFDERFESLCADFRDFHERLGARNPDPILGYELFPSVTVSAGGDAPRLFGQIAPEQINRLFGESWKTTEVGKLAPSEAPLPVVSFTMEGLPDDPRLALFGASPQLVWNLNDKATQYRMLRAAGLPLPPFTVLDGVADLEQRLASLLSIHGAVFLQPTHSAGGELATLIRSRDDLVGYSNRLEAAGVSTSTSLVATRFFSNVSSLSGHGLITRQGRILALAADELLLNGFRFDGFLFPVTQGPAVEKHILELTVRVGHVLAATGYWGYFAADFLYRDGVLLLINEVNVRFAGEAAFLASCMPHNLFCLLDGEEPDSEPLIRPQSDRIVVTKIRPTVGHVYAPMKPYGSVQDFMAGDSVEFRKYFYSVPIQVVNGHFVGIAGKRFPLQESKETLTSFYVRSRTAFPSRSL